MKIELKNIKVRDLVAGYKDDGEDGVFAYGGLLTCRPPYQREFIYDDAQQQAVINTVLKGFPLNTMYWIARDDGTYEILDGQQRTLSICHYVNNEFSVNYDGDIVNYPNLFDDQREMFLDYELMVFFCSGGTKREQLDWFSVLNVAGAVLSKQELRNAVYHGPFVSDARRLFSKTNAPATRNGYDHYMNGSPIRQQYLETVLRWISSREGVSIEQYMADHAQDEDASALWNYYEDIMTWVKQVFPVVRKEMKSVEWGILYDAYHETYYDPKKMETLVASLMSDDEVKNKRGIYTYVFDRKEKNLNLRTFTASEKRSVYERQGGHCPMCQDEGNDSVYSIDEMDADHITPWSKGGKTVIENCQLLCKSHNRSKGAR